MTTLVHLDKFAHVSLQIDVIGIGYDVLAPDLNINANLLQNFTCQVHFVFHKLSLLKI